MTSIALEGSVERDTGATFDAVLPHPVVVDGVHVSYCQRSPWFSCGPAPGSLVEPGGPAVMSGSGFFARGALAAAEFELLFGRAGHAVQQAVVVMAVLAGLRQGR
ncbi:hypothetical protein [Amycolatopsis sp. cmx-4-68]|uniref:hypothetical protein n=1 Tax=Amycolatopsis sp. cmx-4-68 TaxID=2790938 RepID=UPI00397808A4